MEEIEIVLEAEESEEQEIELEIETGNFEDLSAELTEQDRLITYQEKSLLDVVLKLQGKTGGTSSTVTIKEHYLEGTELHILLSNGQTLIIDISEYVDGEITTNVIEEIEQLIVSNIENKTIEEVEG